MQAPVQSSSAAPEESLDQRMEALKRANDIRSKRAQLKRDLKASKVKVQTLLMDPPEYVQTAKVIDMLMAVPKYGRVKTNGSSISAGSRRRRRSASSPAPARRTRRADAQVTTHGERFSRPSGRS